MELDLQLRPVMPYTEGYFRDLHEIVNITDSELGTQYLTLDALHEIVTSGNNFIHVAELNDRIAGFIIGSIEPLAQVREAARHQELPDTLKTASRIGVVKTVAVSPEARKQGLGSKLVNICIQTFHKQGITALYSTAWKPHSKVNIQTVLEQAGFTAFAEIKEYWREDSLSSQFQCPTCGYPPCLCDAILFSK